ncbi:hypothetical protein LDENG_00002590 [Lucifuga dentata]|nr:hypothetical protein LDENG_00002590 [Lucifuga dentata]
MEVWKVGKTFLIHHSSSMLWEMIVSNVKCMKIEYIRLKHSKWMVWCFKVIFTRKFSVKVFFFLLLPEETQTLNSAESDFNHFNIPHQKR